MLRMKTMLKQRRFAAIVFALTLIALWTPARAQNADPAAGAAAPPALEPRGMAIRMQGATTSTDAEQLRGDLGSALFNWLPNMAPSDRRFNTASFAMHDGRFDVLIYCLPNVRPGRFGGGGRGNFGGGGRGFEPAPLSPGTKELATAADCAAFLKEHFRLAPEQAAWSADQRAARIALIGNELLPILSAQSVLFRAEVKSGINPDALIADRITALRNEIQAVVFGIKAKGIRRTALEMVLAQQQKHDADLGAQSEKQDAMVLQLQNLIELRKQQLQRLQEQAKAGLVTPAELDAAQAASAEAQLRLAERTNELHAGGGRELNDRLTQELAMVSVDLTELEMRLKDLSAQMELYRRGQGDPEAMKQLMQVDPDLARFLPKSDPTTRLAGATERQQSSDSLATERLLLSVSELSFTDATPTTPAQ